MKRLLACLLLAAALVPSAYAAADYSFETTAP